MMIRFITLLSLLLLSSCGQDNYIGYVVCKEYTPEHECHSEVIVIRESIVIVPPRVPPPHHHKTQEAEYKIYVANKDFVRNINVSKNTYDRLEIR